MTSIKSISTTDDALFDQVDKLAKSLGSDFSKFTVQALRNQLESMENNSQGWPTLEMQKEEPTIEVKPVTEHIPKHPEAQKEYEKLVSGVKEPETKKKERCYKCTFEAKDDYLECVGCGTRIDQNGSKIQEIVS